MKREQQQAQAQMAMQLLQMLREGRNQSERLQLARDQMNNEMLMSRRQARMGQRFKEQELSQQEKQFMAAQEQAERKYNFDLEQSKMQDTREQEKLSQARGLAEAEMAQAVELAKIQREALMGQQTAKNQAMMDPQILDYLQKTMTMPPGPERDALMLNLETMTGKTYQRPVDEFQQYVNPNK